jgi:hypothetical protein
MSFPKKIYTIEEIKKAKTLIDNGYKHQLKIKGILNFKKKVKKALRLIKIAKQHDFFRTYIRNIIEINGLTQLRESDATIWTNNYAIENSVDAASLFIQKAFLMKQYLEGKSYYGGIAEKKSIEKRIQFLQDLQIKSQIKEIQNECKRLLDLWNESFFP